MSLNLANNISNGHISHNNNNNNNHNNNINVNSNININTDNFFTTITQTGNQMPYNNSCMPCFKYIIYIKEYILICEINIYYCIYI